MLYKNIPYINILENEYVTSKQIQQFLNISKSIFERMHLNIIVRIGKTPYYSTSELLTKIQERLNIYLKAEFIPDFPNYLVTKNGDIYLVKGKIIPYKLKYKIDKDGYKIVTLSNKNGKKYIGVHRIVAITYLSNPYAYPQVNHKNGDKLNCEFNNLEWCTVKYNINHAFDKGLNKTGIENSKSSPVIAYKNNGCLNTIHENILDCAKYYSISECTVRDSHSNKTTNGRCGYYFRKISKEQYYKLKEDNKYAKKFIRYKNTERCSRITQSASQ